MKTDKEILDFIVVGAQKAGTTSLFEYLKHHPEIYLPDGKEVPYFSNDTAYKRGWRSYMENLARDDQGEAADPARKWGTVTPHYMVGGVYESTSDLAGSAGYDERTVPSRMYECLPDARLIAILRDPVNRAVSHHRMAVTTGRETRSFDEAIDQLLHADALDSSRTRPREITGYIAWGEYRRILAGYFDIFPREQILVVFTDELERDPAQVVSRIQEFIGVRADFEAENLGARYRVGTIEQGFAWRSPSSWMSPSSPLSPQGMQRSLARSSAAQAVWHAIPRSAQHRLGLLYVRNARRAARRNRRSAPNESRANAEPSPATLARLREHYEREGAQLTELLGVAPSWQRPDVPQ
jgi:hypothetical protein